MLPAVSIAVYQYLRLRHRLGADTVLNAGETAWAGPPAGGPV